MDIQPITLDMQGLMQMGLMTQQFREQQRHHAILEENQQAQTQAYTQAHEISGLIQTLDSTTTPAFVKYPALKRLMDINKQRSGFTGSAQVDVDPGEFAQAQQLYINVAKSAATKGPADPETQAHYQALAQSPYATMFNASRKSVMEESQKMAQARGWQALTESATGKPASPDMGQAVASSGQAQAKVADVLAKTPLERQTMESIQAQADDLGVQAGQLDSQRKFMVGYANPSINLTAESQYVGAMFPDGKLGKTASALIGTPLYDNLAQKTGALTSQQRKDLAGSLKDELKGLAAKQQELQQEWRAAHFDAGDGNGRDKLTVEQELGAVQSAVQLKSAELAHVANPSAETYSQLQTVRQTLDQQLEANKQQSTTLKAQRTELLQGASGEKMREFNVNQAYEKKLTLAQQEYAKGELTPRAAAVIAQKYGVKVSDVLPAGKDVNKPSVEVKLPNDIAKEIGPMLTESKNSATGAVDALDAVGRINNALASGNVNLGPTATIRNKIDQLAEVAGIGGKDTAERLVNTRQTIRALAQFTIAARKQLKGQGQVSDFEGKLLQRAESGEIDDFTMPELKAFVGVTERLATKQYERHQQNLAIMRKNDNLKELTPFYEVPFLAPQGGPKSGTVENGYRFKGGNAADPKNWEKVK